MIDASSVEIANEPAALQHRSELNKEIDNLLMYEKFLTLYDIFGIV